MVTGLETGLLHAKGEGVGTAWGVNRSPTCSQNCGTLSSTLDLATWIGARARMHSRWISTICSAARSDSPFSASCSACIFSSSSAAGVQGRKGVAQGGTAMEKIAMGTVNVTVVGHR